MVFTCWDVTEIPQGGRWYGIFHKPVVYIYIYLSIREAIQVDEHHHWHAQQKKRERIGGRTSECVYVREREQKRARGN